jgi:hypothetical protein
MLPSMMKTLKEVLLSYMVKSEMEPLVIPWLHSLVTKYLPMHGIHSLLDQQLSISLSTMLLLTQFITTQWLMLHSDLLNLTQRAFIIRMFGVPLPQALQLMSPLLFHQAAF